MIRFLECAARGKNAWWRYLVVCVAGTAIALVLLTIGFAMLMFTHVLDTKIAARLQQPTDASAFFLGIGATFAAFIAGLAISAWFLQGKRPGDIVGEWRWPLLFAGLAIGSFVQIASTFADYLIAPRGFTLTFSHATLALALFAAFGLAIQTFAEEFIFRGYLTQGFLLALKRPFPASIISGVLFGALHFWNGAPQAVNAIFFGIICSYLAIRLGGIAFTYGLHLANNYFGAAVVVSANDVFKGSAAVITQNTPQLLWWDTAVSLVALLVVALLVTRARVFRTII